MQVRRGARLRLAPVLNRLAGVADRAYRDERLAEQPARGRHVDHPVTVALVHLDRRAQVDDRHGRVAGGLEVHAAAVARRDVPGSDGVE